MFQVVYRVKATSHLKQAFVSANTNREAIDILKGEFLPDAIEIVQITTVNVGSVIYPNGRF